MAYKTTSNAKGLIIIEAEVQRLNEEVASLRRYRKSAKKAYRTLQAAYERVVQAHYDLYRRNVEFREMTYAAERKKRADRKPEVTTKPGQPERRKSDAKEPNKKS